MFFPSSLYLSPHRFKQLSGSPWALEDPGTSRLLELPTSLRAYIVQRALSLPIGSIIKVSERSFRRGLLPLDTVRTPHGSGIPNFSVFRRPLLQVCRQLRIETLVVIVSRYVLDIYGGFVFVMLWDSLPTAIMRTMTCVELSVKDYELEDPGGMGQIHMQKAIQNLATCTSISRLRLTLPTSWLVYKGSLSSTILTFEEVIELNMIRALSRLRCINPKGITVEWKGKEMMWMLRDDGFTFVDGDPLDQTFDQALLLEAKINKWLVGSITRRVGPFRRCKERYYPGVGCFPFFKLPRELRDKIYGYLFVQSIIRIKAKWKNFPDSRRKRLRILDVHGDPCELYELVHQPLLLVSKQMRLESEQIIFGQNIFYLSSLGALSRLFEFLRPHRYQYLKRLSLRICFDEVAKIRASDRVLVNLSECTNILKVDFFLDTRFLTFSPKELLARLKEDCAAWKGIKYDCDPIDLLRLAQARGIEDAEVRWVPFWPLLDDASTESTPKLMKAAEAWLLEHWKMPRETKCCRQRSTNL